MANHSIGFFPQSKFFVVRCPTTLKWRPAPSFSSVTLPKFVCTLLIEAATHGEDLQTHPYAKHKKWTCVEKKRLLYDTPPHPPKKRWKCPSIWLPDLQQISSHTNPCFPAFWVRTDTTRVENHVRETAPDVPPQPRKLQAWYLWTGRQADSFFHKSVLSGKVFAEVIPMGYDLVVLGSSHLIRITACFSPVHPYLGDLLFNFVNDVFIFV